MNGQTVRPRALILRNHLCPGDNLVMTAAVHSLHKAHPGKFLTGIDSSTPAIWEHNPDVATKAQLAEYGGGEEVAMHYPAIARCNQEPIHVLCGYTEFLAHALQVKIPLATNRPLVYLSDEEKGWMDQVEQSTGRKQKFWVLNAGVKSDYTAKLYPWYEEVVQRLLGKVQFVQVGAPQDRHPPVRGAIYFVGKTDQRQLIRLVHHAQGVLTGVSFPMHLAAALKKPCVVVAGSREPRAWNTYPGQVLLNNVGTLPCSLNPESGEPWACWKSRIVRLGDGAEQEQSLCSSPVFTEPPSGRCMAMILPQTVAEAVESYYAGGVLAY